MLSKSFCQYNAILGDTEGSYEAQSELSARKQRHRRNKAIVIPFKALLTLNIMLHTYILLYFKKFKTLFNALNRFLHKLNVIQSICDTLQLTDKYFTIFTLQTAYFSGH